MALKICENGHRFEKTSDCPVCPKCSSDEMNNSAAEGLQFVGAPAFRALHREGVQSLADLTKFSEKELLALHGFGPKALKLLAEKLHSQGLHFKTDTSS